MCATWGVLNVRSLCAGRRPLLSAADSVANKPREVDARTANDEAEAMERTPKHEKVAGVPVGGRSGGQARAENAPRGPQGRRPTPCTCPLSCGKGQVKRPVARNYLRTISWPEHSRPSWERWAVGS
jgi:hypothetical protein